jgi:hypothetical protein
MAISQHYGCSMPRGCPRRSVHTTISHHYIARLPKGIRIVRHIFLPTVLIHIARLCKVGQSGCLFGIFFSFTNFYLTGQSPLELAEKQKHDAIVTVLESAMVSTPRATEPSARLLESPLEEEEEEEDN